MGAALTAAVGGIGMDPLSIIAIKYGKADPMDPEPLPLAPTFHDFETTFFGMPFQQGNFSLESVDVFQTGFPIGSPLFVGQWAPGEIGMAMWLILGIAGLGLIGWHRKQRQS